MLIKIEHPYLVFPVNTNASMKKLRFHRDNLLVEEADIRLDNLHPNFFAYLDMKRFLGETLSVSVSPEMTVSMRFADCMDRPDTGHERYRPYYHFTEQNGWTNDPNGLVQAPDGTYHMFYQLNPAAPQWGNMHWGHATSADMIHWKQEDIALYPDATGTMFSGSGIVDTENRAGFGENTLLFFYTAAGGNNERSAGVPFTQNLAYSVDGGKTLQKYEKNPVIPHIIGANRDPKVIWCAELSAYVCALYLDGNTYGLLKSENFLTWELFQKIDLPQDAECPDFYPLTADDGTRRWILSGASAYYLVGEMKNGQFVPTQEEKRMHTGSRGYAAQTYSTLPDGRRINVSWENIEFPDAMPFHSQMSLPMVHTLIKTEDTYTLAIEPAKEVQSLRRNPLVFRMDETGKRTASLYNAACEFILTLPVTENGQDVFLTVLGNTLTFDRKAGVIRYENEQISNVCPISGKYTIHLFFDTCSVDIFTGYQATCARLVADENLLSVSCSGERDISLVGWQLDSVFRRD